MVVVRIRRPRWWSSFAPSPPRSPCTSQNIIPRSISSPLYFGQIEVVLVGESFKTFFNDFSWVFGFIIPEITSLGPRVFVFWVFRVSDGCGEVESGRLCGGRPWLRSQAGWGRQEGAGEGGTWREKIGMLVVYGLSEGRGGVGWVVRWVGMVADDFRWSDSGIGGMGGGRGLAGGSNVAVAVA